MSPGGILSSDGQRLNVAAEARWQDIYFTLTGANLLLSTVRVLMYLKFNAKLSQPTDTFVNIAGTLLQFLVIWFVNLCAFVLMAHLVFGDRIAAFGSFQAALNEAIGLQLGNADFFGIMEADPAGAVSHA